MYLEAKVLELLSLQLEQSFRPVSACPSLRKPDRIRRVREYLDEHFLNPASLPENTAVFGYAHERRMSLAQKLLNEGIPNVSLVADVVGYENPNLFGRLQKAFRLQSGRGASAGRVIVGLPRFWYIWINHGHHERRTATEENIHPGRILSLRRISPGKARIRKRGDICHVGGHL
jgi:AraC-like DNA-binding protein